MRKLKYFYHAILFLGIFLVLSHEAYAKGHGCYRTHNIKRDDKIVQADKVKIAEDKKEIDADRQALKEAKKSKDKTKIEEAGKKLKQDIEKEKKDKAEL